MMMPWSFSPCGPLILPMPRRRHVGLKMNPGGAFPVPGAIPWQDMPPAVQESVKRLMEGPPKPSVTPQVMNEAQISMIAPDLPYKGDV